MRKRTPYPRLMGRASVAACLAVLGNLAAALPGVAQVGAFGGAPASLSTGDEASHYSMPILTENAVFAPAGTIGGSFLVGVTTGSVALPGLEFDYDMTQTAGSVYYSLSDRAILGASIQPWNSVSLTQAGTTISESGSGDAALHGRYLAWRSPDARSSAAVFGSVGLPLGAEGFGAEGASFGLGIAASRQLDGASLHGSVSGAFPTDEADGEPVISLSTAGMLRVGGRTSIGAELLARFSDGEYVADVAPGVRFQVADRLMIDAAFLVNAATSLDQIYDGGLLLALRFGF